MQIKPQYLSKCHKAQQLTRKVTKHNYKNRW